MFVDEDGNEDKDRVMRTGLATRGSGRLKATPGCRLPAVCF